MRTTGLAGGDECGRQWQKCEVVVGSKFYQQRPFTLMGSSGTMAVQIDTGKTGRQARDIPPGKEFFE